LGEGEVDRSVAVSDIELGTAPAIPVAGDACPSVD